ncbi:MAG: hypothetical protein WA958_05800 [Tunicatimonas sp.]
MERNHTDIKRFIFFTEEPFLIYFGRNYESTVLSANRNCIPVIRIVNANGTHSAIPLERANGLLEKYYRLRDSQAKEVYHANPGDLAPAPSYEPASVAPTTERAPVISGAA